MIPPPEPPLDPIEIKRALPRAVILMLGVAVLCVLICAYLYRIDLMRLVRETYRILSDREQTRAFVEGFGPAAPLVFVAFQTLQVIFAPVPGEATGFIGGYLFGTLKGFVYSSIGLTLGSWINFLIGRFLGFRFVRKFVATHRLASIDRFVKRQGILVLLALFIFPGFPKDYLCLALGMSAIPLKVFLLLTAIGRMPGTFMLSLQGASLYDRNYPLLIATATACAILLLVLYRYRQQLYDWIDRHNGN